MTCINKNITYKMAEKVIIDQRMFYAKENFRLIGKLVF